MGSRQVLFKERQSGFAMLFESLLINVVGRDGLLFGFPRIDNRDGFAACSSSWGMQIASLVALLFSLCNELTLV